MGKMGSWVADKCSLKVLELSMDLQIFGFINLLELIVLASDKKYSLKDSAILTEFVHGVGLVLVVILLEVGKVSL
jgi:hypothetical protein